MGRKRKRVNNDVIGMTSVTSTESEQTSADRTSSKTAVSCTLADGEAPAGHGPVPRNAANERERARMRVLSRAFTRLKTSLPWVPADTKLSKLDTLRLASCYIAHLSRLLAEDDDAAAVSSGPTTTPSSDDVHSSTAMATTSANNIHPLNLTWPFSFSSRTGGGASVTHHFSVPRSTCDVSRGSGVTSPTAVTSTAKVKVKAGADSSQSHPPSLSSTC